MTIPKLNIPPQLKAALTSVLIGFIISALTVLFQAAIQWLDSINPEVPGTVVGMGKYLYSWRKSG